MIYKGARVAPDSLRNVYSSRFWNIQRSAPHMDKLDKLLVANHGEPVDPIFMVYHFIIDKELRSTFDKCLYGTRNSQLLIIDKQMIVKEIARMSATEVVMLYAMKQGVDYLYNDVPKLYDNIQRILTGGNDGI